MTSAGMPASGKGCGDGGYLIGSGFDFERGFDLNVHPRQSLRSRERAAVTSSLVGLVGPLDQGRSPSSSHPCSSLGQCLMNRRPKRDGISLPARPTWGRTSLTSLRSALLPRSKQHLYLVGRQRYPGRSLWRTHTDCTQEQDYRRIFRSLTSAFEVKFVFADEKITNLHILKKIENYIRESQFGIYDISGWNANVTLELGLALGLEETAYIAIDPLRLLSMKSQPTCEGLIGSNIHRMQSLKRSLAS